MSNLIRNDIKFSMFGCMTGAVLTATFTLPSDCKGDKLCMEAKSVLDKDTKFFLEGKITSSGMTLRAGYKGNMQIKGNLQLTDVNLVVTVGAETEAFFEVTMRLAEVVFKGDTLRSF